MNQKKRSSLGKQLIYQLPSYLDILEITTYIAEKQKDDVEVLKQYKSKNRLKAADAQLYQSIVEKLENSKKDFDPIEYELTVQYLDQIQPKYNIGDQIKTITGIELIISKNDNQNLVPEKVSLEIQKDFIYIINIWDNIVLENNGPIDEFLEMYQMKSEWHSKVKLVAISLKSSSQDIIELVTKKKWQCMNHYKLIKKKNQNHQFLDMLTIEELPYALIIGKNGNIVHSGYHYEIDLDDLIKAEMLKEVEDASQVKEFQNSNNNQIQVNPNIINECQAEKQEQKIEGQLISNNNKELNVSQGQAQPIKSIEDQNSDQSKNDLSLLSKNQIEDQTQVVQEKSNQNIECISKEAQVNKMMKEQVKVLKQYLYDIKKELKNFNFSSKFQIILRRIRSRSNGAFKLQQISELELQYKITSDEVETLDYFMEQVWNEIPEHFRIITESEVISLSNNIKERIFLAFTKQDVKITYQPVNIKSINWCSDTQKIVVNDCKGEKIQSIGLNLETFENGILEAQPSINFFSQHLDLREYINTIIEELRSIVTLGPGKKFAPILNYKIFGSQEKQPITHLDGQVLVLMYWECNEDCITQLKNVDKLMVKNNDTWGKIVKFAALNIGNEKEYIKFLEQNQELQSRLLIYNKERAFLTDTYLYAVTKVPYFILVDKFGFIRYVNSPKNLERSIQQLVNENDKEIYKKLKGPIQKQSVDLIQKMLTSGDFYKQLLSFDKDRVIEIKLDFESQKVEQSVVIQKIYLNYYIRDTQEEKFDKLLDQLFSIIPEDRWIIKQEIQQTISIQYPGNKCAVCQKDISKEHKQYYCYFKNEHVCVECAEFIDREKKGMDMYKYHDTLIFINGPLQNESVLHDIDLHKIGKNRKLEEGQKGSQKHDFICNGCNIIENEGHRYIAINARPGSYKEDGYIDYCQNCFLVLKNKDSTEAKNIIAKDANEGMTADSIFTRVLFNYGKYREF